MVTLPFLPTDHILTVVVVATRPTRQRKRATPNAPRCFAAMKNRNSSSENFIDSTIVNNRTKQKYTRQKLRSSTRRRSATEEGFGGLWTNCIFGTLVHNNKSNDYNTVITHNLYILEIFKPPLSLSLNLKYILCVHFAFNNSFVFNNFVCSQML